MLTPELLSEIVAAVEALPADASPVATLRARFPEVRFSRCDASDVRGEPQFALAARYALYLIDTSSHCWSITNDPAVAGGIVLAQ